MANLKRKNVDPEAERLWDAFTYSVSEQQDDMDRMTNMRSTLDASIKDAVWPTISKIPLAEAWATTEAAVGPVLDYLYPSTRFINMIALDEIEPDVRDRVAWALHVQLLYRMRMKYTSARSIRDSLSVSVGYSIIEPITITPPVSMEIVAGENRTRQMGRGRPIRSLRHKYISPGKIMPFPQGTDFNGPDATPTAFYLDTYPEGEFRKLYDKNATDTEDILLKGDPDEIVEMARTRAFGTGGTMSDFVEQMSGRKQRSTAKKGVPVSIPVLKCYEDGKHTWLFCGGGTGASPMVIFTDDAFSASRKPLIKWDPWLDSDRWFPMSQPEADMHNVWAKNVWFNAVFDLMTYGLKRPLVYDSESIEEAEAAKLLSPRGIAGIPGDVNKSAKFLDPPGIGQDTIQFGNIIDANHRRTTGERDFTERNFTRGGSMAFQDLVQSSNWRERLRHAMFQMGSLESVAEQTLIYMQTLGSAMDLRFQRPAYRDGKDYMEQFTVTEDDLRHSFGLMLDLDSKSRLGSMDAQMKLQVYDREKNSEFHDQYEVARGLYTDEEESMRKVLPRDVVLKKQEELNAAKLEATRAQGVQSQGGGQGMAQAGTGAILGGSQ